MKRKVIQQGPSTLMISLPFRWAKDNRIKRGDEIELSIENDKSLRISKEITGSTKKTEYTLTLSNKKFIERLVRSFYRSGFDEIKLNYSDSMTFDIIKKTLSELLGFEIMEHTSTYCIIKNIAETLDGQFDTMLKRLFFQLFELGEIVLAKLGGNTKNSLLVDEHVFSIYKLTEALRRIISKHGYKGKGTETHMLTIIWYLRKIANEYKYISNIQLKENVSSSAIEYFKKTIAQSRLFFDAMFKLDDRIIDSIMLNKEELLANELNSLFKKAMPDEIIILHHSANIIRRIHDMCEAYWGIRLEAGD